MTMATTEQFSLRWNNFHSNMTSGFHNLLETAEMVDVTLAVDGHFLQAHKIVLSICSPYFKQMFKVNPCKHPIVILRDVGHENMKDILEFMYMGEVSVLRENLTQFLRTAELLQVKGLTGDDSSEDASSSKDAKTEGETEDENDIYSQLIETDVELPPYSQSPPSQCPPTTTSATTKRTKNNNGSTNGKRSKVENHQSPLKSHKSDFESVQVKSELNTSNNASQPHLSNDTTNTLNTVKPSTELEDIKEPINLKTMWDNNFSSASSTELLNSSDQVNNFGFEWEVGYVESKTPYKAGTGDEIKAKITLNIALRGMNITLQAEPPKNTSLEHEEINYVEHFDWTWDQGRFGFGPMAGKLHQDFRAAQYKGLPLPILWVVDYFIIDGEGHRNGRFYRTAGWYTHILIWSAFPCWLLSLILLKSVIRYGGYFLGFCGLCQLFANLIYLVVRNPLPVVVPFEEGVLTTKFGFNFWCTFVMGIICCLMAIAIIFMDYKYDQQLYNFFGVNPLNSYDEVVYLTKEERLHLRSKTVKKTGTDIPLVEVEAPPNEIEDEDVDYIPVYMKRRTIVSAPSVNRGAKPNRHKRPLPPPGPSKA